MFVNNFLAPMQVQLSPNLVSHTLGTGDEVIKFWKIKVKRHGRWGGGGTRSTEPFQLCNVSQSVIHFWLATQSINCGMR